MSEKKKICVGSRKSELALIQTNHVISLLKELNPDKDFEIVTMTTLGDKVLDIPLPKIGEKSLFTKELETALHTGHVDFVVHSLKDLPTTLPTGMAIGAVLTREDPRDALVLGKDYSNHTLDTLPNGSVIGTSSLRRTAQLAKKYSHLKVESIRGNLNTRLRKLDELGKFSAIILASAGLKRMGWEDRISKILETNELLYAVGQGALAVECRENDEDTLELLRPLYDIQTAISVIAERSCLRTLGGGCSAPVAVCTNLTNVCENKFEIAAKGAVWSLDGKEEIIENDSCLIKLDPLKMCASCPYNKNPKDSIEDIECLKDCISKCTNKNNDELPIKRARFDDVPTELLKNDPHNNCPVQIPIGADFMGKCPYLESNLVKINDKHPVVGDGQGSILNISKCPFFKMLKMSNNNTAKNVDVTESSDSNLFSGIVPHRDVNMNVFKQAENLGERLAKKLISLGAIEIMSKAQAIVHSGVGTVSHSNSDTVGNNVIKVQ